MKAALFAFSRRGIETARRIRSVLGAGELYTGSRLAQEELRPIPQPSQAFYGEQFAQNDTLIFVCSCGIAVRAIAPHVRSKATDPAVLVIDEQGKHVISLLSGHIGGANELTRQLARALDAEPVITTATDLSGKFSVDAWAAEHGFVLGDLPLAKDISARILEREIPMASDFPVESYPSGVVPGTSGELGLCISWETKEPFERTLRLIPRVLHLGIGCRRGTAQAAIERAVEQVFRAEGLELRAVRCVSSIDLKQDEAGLLAFAERAGLPISFYSAQALNEQRGSVTSSAFVQKVTGTDCVCERAALMGADRLIVKKTAIDGVTVAVAAEKVEISFG